MTTRIDLQRLQFVPHREVWPHEALDFTPWLAENLELLSESLGLPLELTGTEEAVENFAADILARDLRDGSNVLIENQLEKTDHTHLGQILTYLAGLEAKTIVWISPQFQDAHLSAIRWLNDHTSDDISFFAVQLRVARIGNSPYAPVFEVLAKPSEWERRLQQKAERGQHSPETERYFKFWSYFLEKHPSLRQKGAVPQYYTNLYDKLADGEILISLSIGKQTGIYVRGPWGDLESAKNLLTPHLESLAAELGAQIYKDHKNGHLFGEFIRLSIHDESNWEKIADWLESKRKEYAAAILKALDQADS